MFSSLVNDLAGKVRTQNSESPSTTERKTATTAAEMVSDVDSDSEVETVIGVDNDDEKKEDESTQSLTKKQYSSLNIKDDKQQTSTNVNADLDAVSTDWLLNNPHTKDWIDQWTTLGLSKYISLPMICVLGDTSSGKSSVLSSLVGIELPSASTLTTKCPVLIQLKKTTTEDQDARRAIVDIQWFSSDDGSNSDQNTKHLRQRKRTIEKHVEDTKLTDPPSPIKPIALKDTSSLNLLPPPPPPPPPPVWKAKSLTTTAQLAELSNVIQDAQQVILEYRDTIVAPDVVCVTYYSPDCHEEELTLVDLPGLVQFQHTQDEALLSQVQQILLNYLNNPRSILLPVIAAPTNIYNSKVLQLAKSVDPTTSRTIPVLTKPDLMDPGSESDILELLQQEPNGKGETQFQHSFFLVKNRGQALLDNGATLAEGLEEEAQYFKSTLPWNALSTSQSTKQLGIPALRQKCAKVLADVMKQCMPEMMQELKELQEDAQEELDDMGTIFHTQSEQRKYFHGLSQTLVSQISTSLSGKSTNRMQSYNAKRGVGKSRTPISSENGTAAGASQLHSACRNFFQEIQSGSLATITSLVEGATVLVSAIGIASATSAGGEDVKGEIVFMDRTRNFACVDFVDHNDHSTDVLFDGVGYTSSSHEFDNDEVWTDGSRVFIGRHGGTFDSLRKLPLQRIRTDPSWLVDKMAQYRTDDLACFVNVDMFSSIVAEFVQDDWAPPCQQLLEELENILNGTLEKALKDHLGKTRFPLLKQRVETTCKKVAQDLIQQAKSQVDQHLQMEEQHPYTQDEVLLEAMNKARYQSLRNDLNLQLRLDQEKQGGLGGVVYDSQAIETMLNHVFEKHTKQDWMAEQMELVLSCYGKVATQRVLDRTPQICWQTFRQFPHALQEELGCVTDSVLEHCLWESRESRERYQSLTTKLHDLTNAMDVVKSIR